MATALAHTAAMCEKGFGIGRLSVAGKNVQGSWAPVITALKNQRCVKAHLVQKWFSRNVGSAAEVVTEEDLGDCEVVMGKDVVIGFEEDEVENGLTRKLIDAADVDLTESDGLAGHLVQPVKNRNGSGILLLSDVRGFEDKETRDFAYRLACFGYCVLIPDLFHGNPWDPSSATQDYESWRATHSDARVAADVDSAAFFLKTLLTPPETPGLSRIAVLGFCFGGGRVIEALARDGQRVTEYAALNLPDRTHEHLFSAAVFFYGTRFDPTIASDISVPMLLITGDNDSLCPMEAVQEVARRAGKKGKNEVVTRVYVGRGHAFAHKPETGEEDEDAEDAFKATRQWLHEHLLEGSLEWLEPIA